MINGILQIGKGEKQGVKNKKRKDVPDKDLDLLINHYCTLTQKPSHSSKWPCNIHTQKMKKKSVQMDQVHKYKRKPLEKNKTYLGVYLCDLEFSNVFLDLTPKAQITQEKINRTLSTFLTFVLQTTPSRK